MEGKLGHVAPRSRDESDVLLVCLAVEMVSNATKDQRGKSEQASQQARGIVLRSLAHVAERGHDARLARNLESLDELTSHRVGVKPVDVGEALLALGRGFIELLAHLLDLNLLLLLVVVVAYRRRE